MMKLVAITAILALPLALSACDEINEWEAEIDAEQQAADLKKCNSQGFVTGTNAMATCMATISNERQAAQARAEASYQASEARKKAKKKTDISRVPASTRPTAESMGVDPGTANMTRCSDGALREDCSFAPLDY
ncbi:hypothetical protein [Primorskyibacter flagellatus]|uniref:Lipoprotein n=1 Tax=Primorskyibacter flagellatus TaxID=1387277 RepID=A0A1W1ZA59_9RHOB|nr:hypothetical protein [Primorskyibacter flagellatus]SMC45303.1 hypothetical protein SAMN06295998_101382 [Primorskyibacter flagellatus]